MNVTIRTVVAAGALVIETQGELDVYTAPQLQAAINQAVEAGNPKVIVDLRPVTFLDSTALGVLVSGLREVRANGGELRLVVDHPHISKMFRITGFDTVFSISTSMEEAMAE